MMMLWMLDRHVIFLWDSAVLALHFTLDGVFTVTLEIEMVEQSNIMSLYQIFVVKNVEDISNGWIICISLHLEYALRIYLGGIYSSCNFHRIIEV